MKMPLSNTHLLVLTTGFVCATDGCSSPAGATYSMTCPTGYFLCPSSASYGCCINGMGCAVESCYSTSPSTTTLTYTTTEDGSVKVITTTSVTTPALPTGDSASTAGVGAVPKYYASTVSKSPATSTSTSSSSGGGLSKGAIGGIIAGVVVLLIVVITAAYFIIKRLKKTERVVQSVRETTSGTRTRQTTDKKSEVSQVRVRPTPSEVDQMDYDPLMMNNSSSMGSPRGSRQVLSHNPNRRARGDSDAESQRPSLWSGPSAGMRWNTPSVDSDPGDGGNGGAQKEYFELPPRTHVRSTATTTTTAAALDGGRPQMPMRASMESSSQYSYHNYAYGHGRHWSNASELSAGSDDHNNNISQHGGGGMGSPLMRGTGMPTHPQELGVEGEFRPELPGSDTETESNHGGSSRPRPPRRRSTGIVSPMSAIPTTNTTRLPPMAQGNNTASRRRGNSGNSLISPVEEENNQGGEQQQQQQHRRALGSIDESVSTMAGTESSKGHLGRPITGLDMAGAPMGLGLSLMGGLDDEETKSNQQDGVQGKST